MSITVDAEKGSGKAVELSGTDSHLPASHPYSEPFRSGRGTGPPVPCEGHCNRTSQAVLEHDVH